VSRIFTILLLFTGNRRYIQSLALQQALIWTSYGTSGSAAAKSRCHDVVRENTQIKVQWEGKPH
jgi:hypothetical protein